MKFKFNETETELLRYACSVMVSELSKEIHSSNKDVNRFAILQREHYERLEQKLNKLF